MSNVLSYYSKIVLNCCVVISSFTLSGVYQEQRHVCSGGSGPAVDDHRCWCSYNCTHAPASPSAGRNVRLCDVQCAYIVCGGMHKSINSHNLQYRLNIYFY